MNNSPQKTCNMESFVRKVWNVDNSVQFTADSTHSQRGKISTRKVKKVTKNNKDEAIEGSHVINRHFFR